MYVQEIAEQVLLFATLAADCAVHQTDRLT